MNNTLALPCEMVSKPRRVYLQIGDNVGSQTMSGWFGLGRSAALVCALLISGAASGKPLVRNQCRLEIASRYVGAQAVPAVRNAIRDIASPLPVRWIIPGRAIKPDFRSKRLNVILDEKGQIMNMRCG